MDLQLSIVVGTLNRLPYLQEMLASVISCVKVTPYEIIILDGGSEDGTLKFLDGFEQRTDIGGIKVIRHGERRPVTQVYNEGFGLAEAPSVLAMNDDSVVIGPCVNYATQILEIARVKKQPIPQVIIPFLCHGRIKVDYMTLAGDKWPYANFGVTDRETGDYYRWWGTRYARYAGDGELSMKLWNARLAPLTLYEEYEFRDERTGEPKQTRKRDTWGYIDHREVQDPTRKPNTDSAAFYARWKDWKGVGDVRYTFG